MKICSWNKLGKRIAQVVVAGALVIAGPSHALTLLGQDPDPSVIVSAGGLEWVWAGPCAATGCSNQLGAALLHHDFRIATDAEWNASFGSIGALISAFELTPGGDVRCASTYFNQSYDSCDKGDAEAGFIWLSTLALSDSQRNNPQSETFLVRAPANVVPEPATLALLGLVLAGAGLMRRRKS